MSERAYHEEEVREEVPEGSDYAAEREDREVEGHDDKRDDKRRVNISEEGLLAFEEEVGFPLVGGALINARRTESTAETGLLDFLEDIEDIEEVNEGSAYTYEEKGEHDFVE